MLWFAGIVAVFGIFAFVDRLTDRPILRRYVNRGTDRYRERVASGSSDVSPLDFSGGDEGGGDSGDSCSDRGGGDCGADGSH